MTTQKNGGLIKFVHHKSFTISAIAQTYYTKLTCSVLSCKTPTTKIISVLKLIAKVASRESSKSGNSLHLSSYYYSSVPGLDHSWLQQILQYLFEELTISLDYVHDRLICFTMLTNYLSISQTSSYSVKFKPSCLTLLMQLHA